MHNKKIEEKAIRVLRDVLDAAQHLNSIIYENDKTPFFDGVINLHSSSSLTKDDYIGSVDIQVKGTTQRRPSGNRFNFPLHITDINAYARKPGGAILFVVWMGNDERQIFYKCFSQMEAKHLYDKTQAQKTVTLCLHTLPTQPEEIEKICEEHITQQSTVRNRKIPNLIPGYVSTYIESAKGNLTSAALYLENEYSIEGACLRYSDSIKLVGAFLSGELSQYLENNHIIVQESEDSQKIYNEINTLIVSGDQCVGKSAFIAQIIHRISKGELPKKKTYLLSFNQSVPKDITLTLSYICDILGISSDELLADTLLLIDAIDESGWSQSRISTEIGNLASELQGYNSQMIITCRNAQSDISHDTVLNIVLHAFSNSQAYSWLDKYKKAFPEKNLSGIYEYIDCLSYTKGVESKDSFRNTADIILKPYIMEVCIDNEVKITSENSLAAIYESAFFSRTENWFHTKYNVIKKHVAPNDQSQMLESGIQLAQISLNNNNTISEDALRNCVPDEKSRAQICTQFLLSKNGAIYSYAHHSIPKFLVAKKIYQIIRQYVDDRKEDDLIKKIQPYLLTIYYRTPLVHEFLHKIGENDDVSKMVMRQMLVRFINGKLRILGGDVKSLNEAISQINYWCNGLIWLYSAFCGIDDGKDFSQNIINSPVISSALQDYQCSASGYLHFCSLEHVDLKAITFRGVDFSSRIINHSVLQYADFSECIIKGGYVIASDLSLSTFRSSMCGVTQFYEDILSGCDFCGANLNGAIFTACNLTNADFRGAKVTKTRFDGCFLEKMKIDLAQIKELPFTLHDILQNKICVYDKGPDFSDILLSKEELEKKYCERYPIRAFSQSFGIRPMPRRKTSRTDLELLVLQTIYLVLQKRQNLE